MNRSFDREELNNYSWALMTKRNQIESLINGLVIGDALGVPVEFRERGTYVIRDMTGFGTYNQPLGTWSDDTSLTLCLIENLYEGGDLSQLLGKFEKYLGGYLTPWGECFDIGISTSQAIQRFKKGTPPELCGGATEFDNGNGALMRIAPLVITLSDNYNFKEIFELVRRYTVITHRHPRSIVASFVYILVLKIFLNKNVLEKTLAIVDEIVEKTLMEYDSVYLEEYNRFFKPFINARLFEEPENSIISSGYVVDTLKAAIWCVGTSQSYEEAVLKAVNLGGDTDTIGSIAGAMAGLRWKHTSIPDSWIHKLASFDLIEKKKKELLQTLPQWSQYHSFLKKHGLDM